MHDYAIAIGINFSSRWVELVLVLLPLHMKHPRSDDPDDEERYQRSTKLQKQLGPEFLSTRAGPGKKENTTDNSMTTTADC